MRCGKHYSAGTAVTLMQKKINHCLQTRCFLHNPEIVTFITQNIFHTLAKMTIVNMNYYSLKLIY